MPKFTKRNKRYTGIDWTNMDWKKKCTRCGKWFSRKELRQDFCKDCAKAMGWKKKR